MTAPRTQKPSVDSVSTFSRATTRALLAGVAIAPIFLVVAVVQMLARPGFDLTRHAVSSLENGEFGWVQSANFLVCGVLAVVFAVGVRRLLRGGPAGTWGPVLMTTFAAGMVIAGIFAPDPALGFPVGSPEGPPETMSVVGALHTLGFFLAFISLIAGAFVFARGFSRRGMRGWAMYSMVSGVIAVVLIVLGNTVLLSSAGIFYFTLGVVIFVWLSAVAAHLAQLTRS